MADAERQPSEIDLLRERLEREATTLRGKRGPKIPRAQEEGENGTSEEQRLLDTEGRYSETDEMDEEERERMKRTHSNIASAVTSTVTSASSSGIEIKEQLEGLSLTDDREFPELKKRTQKEDEPIKNPRNTGTIGKTNVF